MTFIAPTISPSIQTKIAPKIKQSKIPVFNFRKHNESKNNFFDSHLFKHYQNIEQSSNHTSPSTYISDENYHESCHENKIVKNVEIKINFDDAKNVHDNKIFNMTKFNYLNKTERCESNTNNNTTTYIEKRLKSENIKHEHTQKNTITPFYFSKSKHLKAKQEKQAHVISMENTSFNRDKTSQGKTAEYFRNDENKIDSPYKHNIFSFEQGGKSESETSSVKSLEMDSKNCVFLKPDTEIYLNLDQFNMRDDAINKEKLNNLDWECDPEILSNPSASVAEPILSSPSPSVSFCFEKVLQILKDSFDTIDILEPKIDACLDDCFAHHSKSKYNSESSGFSRYSNKSFSAQSDANMQSRLNDSQTDDHLRQISSIDVYMTPEHLIATNIEKVSQSYTFNDPKNKINDVKDENNNLYEVPTTPRMLRKADMSVKVDEPACSINSKLLKTPYRKGNSNLKDKKCPIVMRSISLLNPVSYRRCNQSVDVIKIDSYSSNSEMELSINTHKEDEADKTKEVNLDLTIRDLKRNQSPTFWASHDKKVCQKSNALCINKGHSVDKTFKCSPTLNTLTTTFSSEKTKKYFNSDHIFENCNLIELNTHSQSDISNESRSFENTDRLTDVLNRLKGIVLSTMND